MWPGGSGGTGSFISVMVNAHGMGMVGGSCIMCTCTAPSALPPLHTTAHCTCLISNQSCTTYTHHHTCISIRCLSFYLPPSTFSLPPPYMPPHHTFFHHYLPFPHHPYRIEKRKEMSFHNSVKKKETRERRKKEEEKKLGGGRREGGRGRKEGNENGNHAHSLPHLSLEFLPHFACPLPPY